MLRRWHIWVRFVIFIGPGTVIDPEHSDHSVVPSRIPILAAAGGCMVTRTASRFGFKKQGRALVTQDLIPELGNAFADIFGDDAQFGDRGKL